MEAFEGSKDVFKSLGEKAKKYGKIALKGAKKAAGLHVGQVTEANPMYFIVVAYQGAMVRKEIELDSPTVHGLRRGDLVTCVDISGRRAKIIEPVEGWVSIKTQDNEPILEMTIAPDKSTQVNQMEKRFEKLKAEQKLNRSSLDEDKVLPAPGQAEAIPDMPVKEADSATVNTIKSKLSFKSSHATESISKNTIAPIPKLGGPGLSKKPPANPVADLFTFDSPTSKDRDPPLLDHAPVVVQPSYHPVAETRVDPFADLLDDSANPNQQAPVPHFVPTLPVDINKQGEPNTANKDSKKATNDFDDWFK
jgi:hypothetical protein